MSRSSKIICLAYGVMSLIAAILIFQQNIHYISESFFQANLNFWTDAVANPAARSVTIDIVVIYFCSCLWMIVESRRNKIKHVWAYIIFGYLAAIAITFPLFLIAREVKLSSRNQHG